MTALQQRILDYLRAHSWQCRAAIVEGVQISAAEDGIEPPDPAAIHEDLRGLFARKLAQMRPGVLQAEYAVAEAQNVAEVRPEYKPATTINVPHGAMLPNPAITRAERVLSALQASPEGLSVGALSKLLTLSHTHVRAALRQLGDRVANSAVAGEHGVYHVARAQPAELTLQGVVSAHRQPAAVFEVFARTLDHAAEHANPRGDERGRIAAHDETHASQATVDNGASAPDVQPPVSSTRSAAVEPAPSAAGPGVAAPGADVSDGAADAAPLLSVRVLRINRVAVWSDGQIEIVEADGSRTVIPTWDARKLAGYLSHITEIPDPWGRCDPNR